MLEQGLVQSDFSCRVHFRMSSPPFPSHTHTTGCLQCLTWLNTRHVPVETPWHFREHQWVFLTMELAFPRLASFGLACSPIQSLLADNLSSSTRDHPAEVGTYRCGSSGSEHLPSATPLPFGDPARTLALYVMIPMILAPFPRISNDQFLMLICSDWCAGIGPECRVALAE